MNFENFNRRFPVSRETYDRLQIYHDLLIKWQRSINLISPTTIDEIWERHILDACQFHRLVVSRETALVDLGTGAGIPGVILAILGVPNIHLVESDQRKTIFLEEAKRQLSLSYAIHCQRIEKTIISHVGFVTARGCAPLSRLFTLSQHFLSPETICLFAKGKNYAKEVEEAEEHWTFERIIHPSITDSDAAILELSHILMR